MLRILCISALTMTAACTSSDLGGIRAQTLPKMQLSQPIVQSPAPSAQSRAQVIKVQSTSRDPGYKKIGGGKYKLTRDMTFNTRRFGRVRLTKGYESDGSSSPISDTHESRIAGFLHDALYAASNRLKFDTKYVRSWTRNQADSEYCEMMTRLGVSARHQAANCWGVKHLPTIEAAWKRLEKKRKRRWKKRARKHRRLQRQSN